MERHDLDVDERIRRVARPDQEVADRLAHRALTTAPVRRAQGLRWLAPLLVGLLVLGAWWFQSGPSVSEIETDGRRTATAVPGEMRPELSPGDVVSLHAPDGTTTIISVPRVTSAVPPGTGYVISVGEAR